MTIGLWAKPGAEKDHRVTEVRDHFACDARVAYTATRSISSRGLFEAELVVEFDESGRVIQR